MKTVTIPKDEFDDLVYPAVALTNPENLDNLRLVDKILNKLEENAIRDQPIPPSMLPPGQRKAPPPLYLLIDTEATFEFEDEEARFVKERLESYAKNVQSRRSRALLPIFDALETG